MVGTVVPGSTLIIGISALATSANANPWLLVIAATAGAIIGDGLSFWLSQRYHREILNSWPLNKYPHLIARSERFVTQYGASVFLARFARRTRLCLWSLASSACRRYSFMPRISCRHLRGHPLIFSWRAGRDGASIDHPKRRAAHNSRNRRVDCCDLHYFCHTLVLQGQVIFTNRITPYRPYRHATVSERCLFFSPVDICRLVWNVR